MAANQFRKGVLIASLRASYELGIANHRINGWHRVSKSGRQSGPRPKRRTGGVIPKMHAPPPQESDRAQSSFLPKGITERYRGSGAPRSDRERGDSAVLQGKLRQWNTLFHRHQPFLMNEFEAPPAGLVLHVKITNHARCQRQHNHTIADRVTHCEPSIVKTGSRGARLQRGEQNLGSANDARCGGELRWAGVGTNALCLSLGGKGNTIILNSLRGSLR